MAVPLVAYEGILTERFGQLIVTRWNVRLIVFDAEQERVVRWIG